MDFKHKNVSVRVMATKKVSDICVVMDIPFKCCWCCLNCLKHNDSIENKASKYVEHSALAYAVLESVRDKLNGSPLETMKLRVSQVSCSSGGGKFVISWNTQGTLSNLRRTSAAVLSCLTPHKMYAKYVENMKMLGLSTNKGEFNKSVSNMIAAINSSVCIVAVGKINITKEKLAAMTKVLAKKVPAQKTPPVKSQQNFEEHGVYEIAYPTVSVTGFGGYLLVDYIMSKSGGMAAAFTGSSVIIYNRAWETKKKQLALPEKINDYVEKKYKKIGSHLTEILTYHIATHHQANCQVLTKISKGVTAVDIKSALKSAIN
jgi:hypothetical protein